MAVMEKSTFALPDLQGNAPMHPGQGQGLSLQDLGEIGGTESVTLLKSEMPSHAHGVGRARAEAGDSPLPTAAVWAQAGAGRGAAALYIAGPPTGKVDRQFPGSHWG